MGLPRAPRAADARGARRAARDPLGARARRGVRLHQYGCSPRSCGACSTRATDTFEAAEIGTIGDPAKVPLPVDISLSRDDKFLFVDTFFDGMVRVFDVSNPREAKQVYEHKIGAQVNMVSQSWDGKRLYFTSPLLGNWDGTNHADEQFLTAFTWDGAKLTPTFALDFT